MGKVREDEHSLCVRAGAEGVGKVREDEHNLCVWAGAEGVGKVREDVEAPQGCVLPFRGGVCLSYSESVLPERVSVLTGVCVCFARRVGLPFQECVSVLPRVCVCPSRFDVMDADRSGLLDRVELQSFLAQASTPPSPSLPSVRTAPHCPFPTGLSESLGGNGARPTGPRHAIPGGSRARLAIRVVGQGGPGRARAGKGTWVLACAARWRAGGYGWTGGRAGRVKGRGAGDDKCDVITIIMLVY